MRTITTLASLLLAGCSTITTMDGRPVEAADAACDVRVYQTYQAAIRQGPIDALCVITGTSSMSFVHTSPYVGHCHRETQRQSVLVWRQCGLRPVSTRPRRIGPGYRHDGCLSLPQMQNPVAACA